MTKTKLEKELQTIREKLYPLREKYWKIQTEISKLSEKEEKLIDKISEIEIKEMVKNKNDDWKYILASGDGEDSMSRYGFRQEKMEEIGLRDSGGYFEDTKQAVPGFETYKSDTKHNNKVIKGIKKILPYLKPSSQYKGEVYFDIMEETLSAGGIFFLLVNKKTKKCRLMKTTYGNTRELKKFDDIEKALKYISTNHYYQVEK